MVTCSYVAGIGIGQWAGVGVRGCVGHSDWLVGWFFLGVGLVVMVFVGSRQCWSSYYVLSVMGMMVVVSSFGVVGCGVDWLWG